MATAIGPGGGIRGRMRSSCRSRNAAARRRGDYRCRLGARVRTREACPQPSPAPARRQPTAQGPHPTLRVSVVSIRRRRANCCSNSSSPQPLRAPHRHAGQLGGKARRKHPGLHVLMPDPALGRATKRAGEIRQIFEAGRRRRPRPPLTFAIGCLVVGLFEPVRRSDRQACVQLLVRVRVAASDRFHAWTPSVARSDWRPRTHARARGSGGPCCPQPAARVGRFGWRVVTASLVERRRGRRRPRDRGEALAGRWRSARSRWPPAIASRQARPGTNAIVGGGAELAARFGSPDRS